MKRKNFILTVIGLLLILLLVTSYRLISAHQTKQEMMGIEFNQIHLFMTRQEVSKLYGLGTDKTAGCFGCEMNFLYPKMKLYGRYSETLDKSPKVKMMTTADPSNTVFDIRIGDTFEQARSVLESKGFSKQGSGQNYVKGLYYIQLWSDGNFNDYDKLKLELSERDNIIRSITIGYRVMNDEKIQY